MSEINKPNPPELGILTSKEVGIVDKKVGGGYIHDDEITRMYPHEPVLRKRIYVRSPNKH